MFDTHCHIQFNAYKDDADAVIKRCQAKGMIINTVGSQRDTSERAIYYAEKYDNIYATVGLHPIHLNSMEVDEEEIKFRTREEKFDYEYYKKLASHPKVIAIGECGIEAYHLPANVSREELIQSQMEVFKLQIQLAKELDLPLVIHVRNAYSEALSVIANEVKQSSSFSAVMHCYSGDWPTAQKILDLGLYIGFTGIITFPPKKLDTKPQTDLLEVVQKCPLDKILIETDSPYLAPQAYRGQRCEPWMVEEVAKKIAEIKNISIADVLNATTINAKSLFTKI